MKITSSVFNAKTKRLTFATKKFNTIESRLYSFDGQTMDSRSGREVPIRDNEATPILASDPVTNTIYVATAGFSEIVKYSEQDLSLLGVAVLPPQLKFVSSMVFINQTLYMVTNEPDAEIGRISEKNFCLVFCGTYGYCDGVKSECACIPDYEKDPKITDRFVCSPSHYIKYQTNLEQEQGTAAAFGVLFAFAVVAGVAGWFLWYRGRNLQMVR
jgi:hypothetical protein